MKRKLVIAVTALNAIDSPGPGVAVIRAIRECDDFESRIIGLSYEALEPGLYMHDLVDKTYQIPYPSGGTESLLTRLQYIHEQENLDLIIPGFDAEMFNFIKLRDKLWQLGISTFLPELNQFEARDKIKLFDFGQKHGFLVPQDKILYELRELKKMADNMEFPIVVKGKFYDAVIAYSYDQAEKAFHKTMAKWGLPIILQEFIKGTEINIAALGDGEGKAISIIPMRKLYITDKGKAWAGITIEDDKLVELARKFIEATKWRGGCELEVMLTDDGKPYIMEVNPRFPAWIYLTAAAGQNQPASLVKMAMGEKVEPFNEYEVGKIFIRYAWDLITNIKEFQMISGNGEL
ncbi:MAG: ATP-grasp domain-containing protein [Paludibacter sp.]|nr:ATP-grasp domain-containing protein [Paludibacter sp.]MDD4199060.1 ATP-grasp domain-containing protein [Paludibacter sp.]MDD4428191.1 ATP-grasp domain-containing protein [Paludibacter sp.]